MAILMLLLAKGYELSKAPWDSGSIFFIMFTAFYAITMFRSRLVVEEHLYWYWASLHWLGYLGLSYLGLRRYETNSIFVVTAVFEAHFVTGWLKETIG